MNKRGIPVLVVAGMLLAVGAACAGDDDSTAGIQAEASATIAVTPGVTAQPTATDQPPPTDPPATATAPPPTDVPPAPTPDTRVAIMDSPTLDQIQLAKDGKYFIADRGDGCTWTEALRFADSKLGEIIVLRTDCPVNFQYDFRPETGDVAVSIS